MKFISTRSLLSFGAAESVVKDNAGGGILVPSSFPYLAKELVDKLVNMSFSERVAKILSLYFDEFDFEELLDIVNKAYGDFEPSLLTKIDDGLYLDELWHGSTGTYFDVSAAIFPHIYEACKRKIDISKPTLVMQFDDLASSIALLDAYDRANVADMLGFFADDARDATSKWRLCTSSFKNVKAIGVSCPSDELKTLGRRATDAMQKDGYCFTRARDVNAARILPLVACFISSYLDLVESEEIKRGEKINFAMPAGNIPLALAGYYAHKMGLPINCLVIGENANKALRDLFESGELDADRTLYRTMSPLLDCLVPEWLEAALFLDSDEKEKFADKYLKVILKRQARFDLSDELKNLFRVGWADEEDTKETVFTSFDLYDCVLDPHTAVAMSVYNDYYCEAEDETATIVMSPACPYLYASETLKGLGTNEKDALKAILKLQSATALECPDCLFRMDLKPFEEIRTISKHELEGEIDKFLKYIA